MAEQPDGSSEKRQGCMQHVKDYLHPYLLPIKAVFFFQIGATACLIPYIPLFLIHLGLNFAENGIVFGVLPFISMVSKPLAGTLSDKLKKPFLLLRVFFVIQLIFTFCTYFIPQISQPDLPVLNISCLSTGFSPDPELVSRIGGNFTCDTVTDGGSKEQFVFSNYTDLVDLIQRSFAACNCSWEPFPPNQDLVRWTQQFWISFLLLIVGWFGYGGAVTLTDAIAFNVVSGSPVRTTYGENRVLGTMGWAFMALLVGLLIDNFSPESVVVNRDFTPAFAAFASMGAVGLLTTFLLKTPKTEAPPVELAVKEMAVVVGKSLWTFDVLLFCFGTFIAGINSGMLYGYLSLYITELHGSNLLVGIVVFIQAAAYEAPMMAISGWIIKKVGYHNCMQMCLLSFGIRFLAYFAMTDPWFVLLIDVVHSVGFGLFYAAITNFAFDRAPTGTTATLQGILGATYEGFGQGIGGIAAGFLYQYYGGRDTFFGYGLFSFGAALFYGAGQIYSRVKNQSFI